MTEPREAASLQKCPAGPVRISEGLARLVGSNLIQVIAN